MKEVKSKGQTLIIDGKYIDLSREVHILFNFHGLFVSSAISLSSLRMFMICEHLRQNKLLNDILSDHMYMKQMIRQLRHENQHHQMPAGSKKMLPAMG